MNFKLSQFVTHTNVPITDTS